MEDNCPPTPLHVRAGRNSKSPNQMAVSSPDSDGMKSPSGRLSPDSRCVICLEKLQKKSFTDSCLHQFCFQCLLQWSKVKPECPLCKQPFKSIIHNVRSNFDYDQYHIERREPAYVVSEILHSYDFDLLPVDRRFRYRSTMTREYFREIAENFLTRTRNSYQVPNFVPSPIFYIPPSARFSPVPERRAARGSSDFRRSVYERDLWVQDLADVTGRYRECTPQFYRENPAQIHRIIPWLNREINCLMRDNESYTAYVLDRIISLLPEYSIRSREFRDVVRPYFGRRTDHFIHEFYTFARSVYDINGFDQHAVYVRNPNYSTEVQEISSSSSSSDDSDVEIIGTLHQKNTASASVPRRSSRKKSRNKAEVTVSSNEPIPGPSGIRRSRITETIDVCESDTDDIKVIDYIKPEPEIITLSSGDEQTPMALSENVRASSFKRSSNYDKSLEDSSSKWPLWSSNGDNFTDSKRSKKRKKVLEKGKSGKFGLKKESKGYGRSRRNRSYTSTSGSRSSSRSSGDECPSSNSTSTSTICSDSSSSASASDDGTSCSDYEPVSKIKSKINSKGHKKCKKSDVRKSPHKDTESRNNSESTSSSSSRQSKAKTKVKSYVVVPRSVENRQRSDSSESSLVKNPSRSLNYSDNTRTDDGPSFSLPSYWSLLLDDKKETSKKRKRSKERKVPHSNHKRSREECEDVVVEKLEDGSNKIETSTATRSLSPDTSSAGVSASYDNGDTPHRLLELHGHFANGFRMTAN